MHTHTHTHTHAHTPHAHAHTHTHTHTHTQYTKVMKVKMSQQEDEAPLLPPPFIKEDEVVERPVAIETVPDCLRQAREVLRLAKAVKAETEEMRQEVLGELELARSERRDAELLKRNAAEILRMAKDRLKTSSTASPQRR